MRHAMGEDVTALQVEGGASGVMMIPIPAAGVYQDASGVDEARAVAGVEDVVITAKAGQALARLPEGRSYLGFIFARASEPAAAEQALREAHGRLRFRIAKALPTVSAG